MHLLESMDSHRGLMKFMCVNPYTEEPKISDLTDQEKIMKPVLEFIEQNLRSESDFGPTKVTTRDNRDPNRDKYQLWYVDNQKNTGIFMINIIPSDYGQICIGGHKILAVFPLRDVCGSSDPDQLSFYTDERQFKGCTIKYRVADEFMENIGYNTNVVYSSLYMRFQK